MVDTSLIVISLIKQNDFARNVDDIPWHIAEPHPALVKHWNLATGGRSK